jgi:hypothetical protein
MAPYRHDAPGKRESTLSFSIAKISELTGISGEDLKGAKIQSVMGVAQIQNGWSALRRRRVPALQQWQLLP